MFRVIGSPDGVVKLWLSYVKNNEKKRHLRGAPAEKWLPALSAYNACIPLFVADSPGVCRSWPRFVATWVTGGSQRVYIAAVIEGKDPLALHPASWGGAQVSRSQSRSAPATGEKQFRAGPGAASAWGNERDSAVFSRMFLNPAGTSGKPFGAWL